MKLLFENTCPKDVTFNDMSVIVEQANAKQPATLKIKGIYISCNLKNVNGRIYDFDYFESDVIPEYRKTWIEPRRAYAELNHAQSHEVNPKDACELITSLTADGTNYIGESVILNSDLRTGIPGTPNGDILASILMRGGKIGKSTRGAVDDPKNTLINKDNQYCLITVDTVLNPSGVGCYINDVVLEQKDYMVNEYGIVVESAYNSLEKNLDNYVSTPDKEKKNEYLLNAFQEFLNELKKK